MVMSYLIGELRKIQPKCKQSKISRTLTKAERQYCVTRKELLAVLYFAKYFKHYLYGKQFTVRIDHS